MLLTANIISGKWTLLILQDVAKGINRYSTLERGLPGISPKTLVKRLKRLQEAGVLTRRSYPEVPPRVEYALTAMGQELIPLVDHMRAYGTKWLSKGDAASDGMPGDHKHGASRSSIGCQPGLRESPGTFPPARA
jgi:DNA-binding HxlR family transcriptional regulator